MSEVLKPDRKGIAAAARALRDGRLVVFPTETVYGVGANALDEVALKRIFAAKGRPADNPLILHVSDTAAARKLTSAWPEHAERLARAFWPGPLTLVLPRGPDVPLLATAGLESVALRVPSHGVARMLLATAGIPVAAPSANRSGRPSPTRVMDAVADLGDAVDIYLDGGQTDLGVESTVVALLDAEPTILRQGGLSREAIEAVVGPVRTGAHDDARSPGTRHKHYAPRAHVHVVNGPADVLVAKLRATGAPVAHVAGSERGLTGPDARSPGPSDDGAAWARALFSLLRDLDHQGYQDVVVEAIPETGIGAAVMDRLRRAAER